MMATPTTEQLTRIGQKLNDAKIPPEPTPESDRQVGGDHYTTMAIEPWDVIDTFPTEQFIGYHRGVALSYIMRAGSKGTVREDFEKAAHHLMKCAEGL